MEVRNHHFCRITDNSSRAISGPIGRNYDSKVKRCKVRKACRKDRAAVVFPSAVLLRLGDKGGTSFRLESSDLFFKTTDRNRKGAGIRPCIGSGWVGTA
jgi:hypothetical protein